jgi:hypothetical protein
MSKIKYRGYHMNKQPRITITEASKLAGISRTALYKTYINKGILNVIRDNKDVHIELSELLRVFPNVNLPVNKNTDVDIVNDNLKHENQLLKNQLQSAETRENWLKSQIDELRHQQSFLLENKIKKRNKFLGIF